MVFICFTAIWNSSYYKIFFVFLASWTCWTRSRPKYRFLGNYACNYCQAKVVEEEFCSFCVWFTVSYYHYKSYIHILLRKNGAELGQSTTSWEAEIDENQSNKKQKNKEQHCFSRWETYLLWYRPIVCKILSLWSSPYLVLEERPSWDSLDLSETLRKPHAHKKVICQSPKIQPKAWPPSLSSLWRLGLQVTQLIFMREINCHA